MRRGWRWSLLALTASSLGGCAPEVRPKVLVIGIDGVRPDVLAEVDTPNIDELIATGLYSDEATTTRPTVSGPAWSSLLTGVWPEKHGVMSNDFHGHHYAEYPDFLTRIESAKPELTTFVAGDWLPLFADDSGGPTIGDAVDGKFVVNGYDLGWDRADQAVTSAAVVELRSGDPDALFVYLGDPDETSHREGSIGEPYREAIARADAQVGSLVRAVRGRAAAAEEDWLILVGTDHGRRADGGHGGDTPEESTIFFLAQGPSVVDELPGESPAIVDVAVTALTHMGIEIDPAWGLDGAATVLRPGR